MVKAACGAYREVGLVQPGLGIEGHRGQPDLLDNLIKPTLDAMEGVFGTRAWNGPVQAADDRVDRLEAVKRQPLAGEEPGATIDVWIIDAEVADSSPLGSPGPTTEV